MVVGGLLLAPRPAMPGLDVAKFATQVVAGFLQRITFAPFQPGISEPVGDLVQLILDIVHALVEAAHVAADFVAMLLGGMQPQAVVVAGKDDGDGLRRAHAEILAYPEALATTTRRRAARDQTSIARHHRSRRLPSPHVPHDRLGGLAQ